MHFKYGVNTYMGIQIGIMGIIIWAYGQKNIWNPDPYYISSFPLLPPWEKDSSREWGGGGGEGQGF